MRLSTATSGSSSHARGTPCNASYAAYRLRFIPACAGNTSSAKALASRRSVHPRMRGEHLPRMDRAASRAGSSPHARGTRADQPEGLRAVRFIPACAGNTSGHRRAGLSGTVHPRMRGEHPLTRCVIDFIIGSSPHARGTLLNGCHASGDQRFIPACAGNTCHPQRSQPDPPVHPRMRGEHMDEDYASDQMAGSSPHARGTRVGFVRPAVDDGFIPACAGNTRSSGPRPPVGPVHPRMRGEHDIVRAHVNSANGSSPHARGTLWQLIELSFESRFIPACAGNTCSNR